MDVVAIWISAIQHKYESYRRSGSGVIMARDPNLTKEFSKKVLSSVSPEHGFHFYTAVGAYTGVYATSLTQFYELLQNVGLSSIEFHLGRKDFENWIRFLGDDILASQLAKLSNESIRGERLRMELVNTIKRRLAEFDSNVQKWKRTSRIVK